MTPETVSPKRGPKRQGDTGQVKRNGKAIPGIEG